MLNYRFLLLFTLSIFVICLFGSSAYASTDRCPRHEIKTSMKNRLFKTKVFRGTSHGFTQYTQGHARGNSRTLGFVEYRGLTTEFETKFEVIGIGNGKYCVKMTEVRGYFNMRPKLYMPTDYKKKSCEYQQVLKHEKRHLKALKDFHESNSKKFEAHLGRIARTVPIPKPVRTQREVDEVVSNLEYYFINNFKELENKAWNLLIKKQNKIDSPQEYRGVSKRCQNW